MPLRWMLLGGFCAPENGGEGAGAGAGGQAKSDTPPVPDKAAGDKAAGDKAAGDKAAGDKAAGDKAAGDKAAGDKAAGDKAAGDKAAGDTAAGDTAAGDTAEAPDYATLKIQMAAMQAKLDAHEGQMAEARKEARAAALVLHRIDPEYYDLVPEYDQTTSDGRKKLDEWVAKKSRLRLDAAADAPTSAAGKNSDTKLPPQAALISKHL